MTAIGPSRPAAPADTIAGMNVIVIACNGLHLGFLGAYGNSWIETPHLDRLAAEGVVFDHHYPENLTTLPTRRSWWTGRYGFADPDQGWTALRPEEAILPDLLWSRGVRSALISDVPMLREPGNGFGRGFDEVVWIRGQGYDPLIPARRPQGRDRPAPRRAGAEAPPRRRPRPRPLDRPLGAAPPEPRRRSSPARSRPRASRGRSPPRSIGSGARAAIPGRSASGSTCSRPTGRGTCPRHIVICTQTVEPERVRDRRGGET